ncbi:MAG TPA: phage tail sheath C-terminal domain-containing protein, partial [Verrucomicrobiae bacterium]|nr:phage tail sheath C-terminal domain-containing protein [Verrucomicrobiae bacterium]
LSGASAIADFQSNVDTTNYSALYFPTLWQTNPLHDHQFEEFAPCGAVAGVMARTDSDRGVWKAPAGLEARLGGVPALSVPLNDADTGQLNPLGINCLRAMPAAGRVIWGARTLEGSDRLASQWKYIPVRRTALFLEESLYRGTQWVVFEPNDEPLWAQIRLNIGAFMQSLFRQGAFQGKTPREAYLVKCDSETTTQTDIDNGIVNILVGFAPLKPAEFVVIRIQQLAGQIET